MEKPANKFTVIGKSDEGQIADDLFKELLKLLPVVIQFDIVIREETLSFLKAHRRHYLQIFRKVPNKVKENGKPAPFEITVEWLAKIIRELETPQKEKIKNHEHNSAISLLTKIENAFAAIELKEPGIKMTIQKIGYQIKEDHPYFTHGEKVRSKLQQDIKKIETDIFELLNQELYESKWIRLRTLPTFKRIKNLNKKVKKT